MATETSMSLDTIETGYTVFETDQVLTAEQLNGVADYLDDQERLTRVALLGVGIACGLWPSLKPGSVRLSHGVGTTTDGDLLCVPDATIYAYYKPYDASTPKYPPFQSGDGMITAFELLTKDGAKDDARAKPLTGFDAAEAPRTLQGMAAVLYLESYLHDPDLCTATDCDNRGQNWVHATRLLLVDAHSAAALVEALDTPDGAARTALKPVAVARPVLQGALAAETDLAAVYDRACDAILKTLLPALGAMYRPCSWFLRDITPTDPAPSWKETMDAKRAKFAGCGMQYYYDFLKDVAETYNAFRDALFGDTAVCCPRLDAFPKHLVLGSLDPAQRRAVGRTAFYPSPMVSERFEQRAHARFLLRKLDTLINTVEPPAPGDIRITPSAFEDRCLEERAIPFYYAVIDALPVNRVWSYRLAQRGMENHNYSYNADRYAAAGAAAAPLQWQLGAFDFFRIEGHIGRRLDQVQKELAALVAGANLPIELVYLSLGQAPAKPPFPWWHLGLYPLRDLARADLGAQLEDAGKFGAKFVEQVKVAAGTVVNDADNNGVPVLGTAQTKTELMSGHASVAMAKVLREDYDPDSNWQDDLSKLTQTAAEMNEALSPVTKKEFVTPLDGLIGGQPARWLTWIDTLIKGAEADAATRSQLPGFRAEHPGLEHYAGVLRGGTFVVVYVSAGATSTVVADFMLPYQCCVPKAAPPKPPKLVPPVRPDIVFEKPIRLVALPDKFRFDQIKVSVGKELKNDIAQKTMYFDALKDTVGMVVAGKAGGSVIQPGGTFVQPGMVTSDPVLGLNVNDMNWKTQKVDALRTQLLDPGLDETKRATIQDQLGTAEKELASTIVTTTAYVAKTGADLAPGSDGATAVGAASAALSKVSNIDALAGIEKGLADVGKSAGTTRQMNTVISNILSGRGML